jgi:hypothetical protein
VSQILESTASSEPTPPGTADPIPLDRRDTATAATKDEAPAPPSNPLEEIQNRAHPFAD